MKTIEDLQTRLEYEALILALKAALRLEKITICEIPFEIDGVLNDQASYYTSQYKEILKGINL